MKKKKIILLIIVLVIGFTYVMFNASSILLQVFEKSKYQTEVIDNYINADNWLPGNTIEKEIYVKNKGDVDVAVRVFFEEEWISKNGKKLSGFQNDNKAALINLANPDDWIKIGDYYYYRHKLKVNEETSNFIDSVTFNVKIEAESGCIKQYEGNIIKTICSSSNNGYAGAKYKLSVTVDTIQYDLYKDVWYIDYEIE